jgi:hypothetical protein
VRSTTRVHLRASSLLRLRPAPAAAALLCTLLALLQATTTLKRSPPTSVLRISCDACSENCVVVTLVCREAGTLCRCSWSKLWRQQNLTRTQVGHGAVFINPPVYFILLFLPPPPPYPSLSRSTAWIIKPSLGSFPHTNAVPLNKIKRMSPISASHAIAGGQSKGIQFIAPQGCPQLSKQDPPSDVRSIRSRLQALSSPSVMQRYISPPLLLNNKCIPTSSSFATRLYPTLSLLFQVQVLCSFLRPRSRQVHRGAIWWSSSHIFFSFSFDVPWFLVHCFDPGVP